MTIKWQKSRSKKKNISQAYLRWYEAGKDRSKGLTGYYKYEGRNLTDGQRRHNKRVKHEVQQILLDKKKEVSQGIFSIEKWEKRARSFVDYGKKWIKAQDFTYGNARTYIQALKLFENYFGKDKQFHTITKADVTNFKVELRENGKSRYSERYELNSINTYINRLKLIYASAQANDDILTAKNNFFKQAYV
ncbi:MAG: hypothetical protein CMC89_05340, partial [Flavobacteriaceae bacterium]|nr:hypothetical protein [Flavobacteriaceae bacterium]